MRNLCSYHQKEANNPSAGMIAIHYFAFSIDPLAVTR
jgi:hypothetical protein